MITVRRCLDLVMAAPVGLIGDCGCVGATPGINTMPHPTKSALAQALPLLALNIGAISENLNQIG